MCRINQLQQRSLGIRIRDDRLGGNFFSIGKHNANRRAIFDADLNYLRAYFLEQAGGDARAVEQTIDRNRDARGWLIFATHDVCDKPSPYGCTPEFFERAVRYAVASGALILPVVQAWERFQRSAAVTSASQ